MKQSTRNEIVSLIQNIEKGDFTSQDIKILLIDIRPFLQKHDPIRDIADFVAHHDERDKGITVGYLQKFVDNFIEVAKSGGKLTVKPVFSQEEIINNIIKDLTGLKFKTNKKSFVQQAHNIMDSIIEIIQDTPIIIKNENVKNANLSSIYDEGKIKSLTFCFNLINMEQGILKIPENVAIGIPAFQRENN